MKYLILVGLLISVFSFAGVQRGNRYNSYKVTPTAEADISFVVAKTIKTDGCNDYGMEARLNPVYSEGPVEMYVLEYHIFHTEIGCEPMPAPQTETVKSNTIKISYEHDSMTGVTILIPADVRVQFSR